jgi:NitT/TauT family transport system substrate-binding protein
MRRRTFFLAPGMTALAAAAAGAVKLRVAGTTNLNLSPLHLAIEKGYFQQHGLEIELVPLARSTDAIPVLAQGGLDAALYALNPPMLNAIGKGVKIRLVAARDQSLPDCGDVGSIYTHPSITTVAGLKGKKVANGHPGGIVEFALDAALQKAGVRPADVELVKLMPTEGAAALLRGEVQALTGPDLSNLKALRRAEFRLLTTMGRTLPGFQWAHVMFGRQLLDGPVDTGARFLRAFLSGLRDYKAGETPAFAIDLARRGGLDEAGIKSLCRTHVVADGHMDLPSLTRFAEWAHGKGYSEKLVPAASLVDGRFLAAGSKG